MSNLTVVWDEKVTQPCHDCPDWKSDVSTYGGSVAASQPHEDHSARISRSEDVWGGTTMVAQSRVPVFMIADLDAEGESVDAILKRYPHLTRADVHSALSYAHSSEGIIAGDRARYWEGVEKYRQ